MNNTQPHIEHDTLAAHAIDALSPDEVIAVGAHLAGCEHCRAELASLRSTTTLLPYGLSMAEPPPDLRERIITRARTGRTAPAREPVAVQRRWGWMARLAPLLAVVTLLLGFVLGQNWPDANLAAQPGAQQVALAGEGEGTFVVVPNQGHVRLQVSQLTPLGQNQVYQLWFLGADAPISAGTFTVDANGRGIIELSGLDWAPLYTGIAITREPPGGSTGPTSDIIVTAEL